MKLQTLTALLLCVFATLAAAWSKEDHEIFRLRDEVIASEGPDATFYSFLGVKPQASQDEINKAYRKKSRLLHPDKARQQYLATYSKPAAKDKQQAKKKPGVTVRKQPTQKEMRAFDKEASARFARLGIVANILRGPNRERYDHFMRNGFPAWRGTGYYYSRFRPGLGSVLLGLFMFCGGAAHYGALYLGWKRQRDFVGRYIRHARRMAWGDELGIQGLPGAGALDETAAATTPGTATPQEQSDDQGPPVAMNRRQKRMQEKEARREAGKGGSSKAAKAANKARASGVSTPVEAELTSGGPRGAKKRVQAENGKVLIVDSVGNVFLEETTEDGETHEFLLDPAEIPKPSLSDTAVIRVPVWLYKRSIGRVFGPSSHDLAMEAAAENDELEIDIGSDGTNGDAKEADAAIRLGTAQNANAEARKRKIKRSK
ncbi:uncharacterized protein K452DRAFT_298155 [Aplosporella prunicola CBS 121167]|uniref:J domain-containing protein n=1 Tax=Aplosporella prunicola CBS 121167 TaxID=1176127 RepID=A0A6A6BDN1_9PEZI|nr:uncharacterized protein K452DRAFT_298155 [Aplosporella prunicola CBS 121167]KAF2142166.1 hypothetical protein K452DRAFT_298155 [Aplosporella prunicola CBS 121167]